MKKILGIFLALSMLLSLVACNDGEQDVPADGSKETTESTTETTDEPTDSTQDTIENTSEQDVTTETKPPETTEPPTTEPPTTEPPTTEPPTTEPPTTEPQECLHLNAQYFPNDSTTYPAPTCTNDGYFSKWCPDCYISFYEPRPARGHSGGTASCKNRAKCDNCQQEYGELDPTTHMNTSSGIHNAVAPTCEKDGYEGDLLYCNDCCTTLIEGAILKAPGQHDLCQRWVNEYKLEVYCSRWYCDYSKYTDIEPINFTFSDIGYLYYGIHTVSVNNPYFKIHVTGGYLDAYSEYKFECYGPDGSEASYTITRDGNTFSLEYYQYFRLGEAVTIIISDYSGHSQTKKITYVLDPSNENKLIFKEIS